jgi:GR25 family glycosyltransferase involved in LPS biosynthesis
VKGEFITVRKEAEEWSSRTLSRTPSLSTLQRNQLVSEKQLGTYVINLDRSRSRWRQCVQELKRNKGLMELSNHKVTRVRAVDGRLLHHVKSDVQFHDEVFTTLQYHHNYGNKNDEATKKDFSKVFEVKIMTVSVPGWMPGNIAVTLSHLFAIRCAYDRGDEIALIFEDDVLMSNKGSVGLDKSEMLKRVLEVSKADSNWSILQLGWIIADDSDTTGRLATAYHNGLLLVPRMPCGNADFQIYGLHAYAISRVGMKQLLDMWWPFGSGSSPYTCSCRDSEVVIKDDDDDDDDDDDGVGFIYAESMAIHEVLTNRYQPSTVVQTPTVDFRLANRLFSESVILDLPRVYTSTIPIFNQRSSEDSETEHAHPSKHSYFRGQSHYVTAKLFDDHTTTTTSYHGTGIQFAPPPLDTMASKVTYTYTTRVSSLHIIH